MQRTLVVTAFFVAALLAGVFLNYLNNNPAPAKASTEETGKEKFSQREVGMPLDMQATEGASGVAGYNGTSPLLGSEPKPVSEKPYDMANDQELFQFEGNRISADCCPSPFSSDTGCVCLTDAQMKQFASRGGNRA
jgi:hypothetical protein